MGERGLVQVRVSKLLDHAQAALADHAIAAPRHYFLALRLTSVVLAFDVSRAQSLRALRLRAGAYSRLGLWHQVLRDLTEIILRTTNKKSGELRDAADRPEFGQSASRLRCYLARADILIASGDVHHALADVNDVLHKLGRLVGECSGRDAFKFGDPQIEPRVVLRLEAVMRRADIVERCLAGTATFDEMAGDGFTHQDVLADYDRAVDLAAWLHKSLRGGDLKVASESMHVDADVGVVYCHDEGKVRKWSRSTLCWRPLYRRARCREIAGQLDGAVSDFHQARPLSLKRCSSCSGFVRV